MIDTSDILRKLTQNSKVLIRVSSNNDEPLPDEIYQRLLKPHRKTHYFFKFVLKGEATHSIDLNNVTIMNGEMLFVLPHQIHLLPEKNNEREYFKLSIDETCLSLLPKSFPFIVNPLNSQSFSFDPASSERVKIIFGLLKQILSTRDSDINLILANLNMLFTEFNRSYFITHKREEISDASTSRFIQFKNLVESELTSQPSVESIARKLATNANNLYYVVKTHSGVSPKEFITNRLILEAQRKLYYQETSVKELAYELGFNDPDYFSKLFKKNTGKSITEFIEQFQDLSG